MPRKAEKAPGPWADLQPDVLEAVACLLSQQDRFKLPLVCSSWREALASAGTAWAAVVVDPRKKASTSRRVRFNKHLPTADALSAWFGRYGRHVQQLHLRNLDAAAQREGCASAADVAALLRAVGGGLRQLRLQHCAAGGLLGQYKVEMRGLSRLTSLHLQALPDEVVALNNPDTDFITCLTALQDLGIASGYEDYMHFLPDTLSALRSLRSLQLIRLPRPGEPSGVFDAEGTARYCLQVASCLTGLTALESLALSNYLLMGVEFLDPLFGPNLAPPLRWFPRAIPGLPRLSRLHISDCGVGRAPAPPRMHPVLSRGLYPLPEGMAQLAAGLRELMLLEHTCSANELGVLSALTALTALRLASKHRRVAASPVPEALSCLTGLAHLRISHGLTQVPPCITGLASLTFLDLSWNQLHSLKPGPYLKHLVAVNLRANAFAHFPKQLRVARHTAQELQLPQNDSMAITERDLEQLLTFERLRQLTIFGASEDKVTRRCLALLQKSMPWLLIDV